MMALPGLLPACSGGAEPAGSSGNADTGGGGSGAGNDSGGASSGGDSGGTTCNGTAVDLASDPLNCGACAHDCLGAACADGLCQPIEVAKIESTLHGNLLAVDATGVYWTDGPDLRRLAPGGAAPEGLAQLPAQRAFTSLALGEKDAFACLDVPDDLAADQSLIVRLPKSAEPMTVLVRHDAKNGPDPDGGTIPGTRGNLAVDTASIYWLGYGSSYLYKAPLDGDGHTVTKLDSMYYKGTPGVGPLVLDGTAYWVDFFGRARSVSTSGGKLTELGQGPVQASSIAADGTHLFWTGYEDGPQGPEPTVLQNVLLKGGAVEKLATGALDLLIAVDATSFYGVDHQRAIVKVPAKGGEPLALTAAIADLGAFASDATSVYWIQPGAGDSATVMKVAK